MNARTLLVLLVLGLAPAVAHAQDDPMLRGPEVPDEVMHTIVRHDAMGRFVRVEGRPEEAALGQLQLDPVRRDQARQVILDRAAALSRLLIERIDLVKDATDAALNRDNARAQALARSLYDIFEPGHEHAPLLAPLEKVLSAEEHARLGRMVDEYWSAWIAWEQRNSRQKDDQAVRQRLAFGLFQEEVRQAYERTLRPWRDRIDRIYTAVDATPEQKQAIRDAVIDFIRASGLRPSAEQRQDLARRIYEALDEDRRVRLVALALF